jgi:hypothetical protein
MRRVSFTVILDREVWLTFLTDVIKNNIVAGKELNRC